MADGYNTEAVWPGLEPLPDLRPDVPVLKEVLLPEAIRPWVMDIAERMQCPLDYPAVAAMVALGSIVGRQLEIRPKRHDDWGEVPNIWGAIIGRSGMMKTPALSEALRPLHRLEADARNAHESIEEQYRANEYSSEARVKALQNQMEAAAKNGDDATTSRIARELADESDRKPPVERRFISNDPTVEMLAKLLSTSPSGILVYRDELVGWLRSFDRHGREMDRQFYLEAWRGKGSYTVDRIGRGTLHVPHACVSVLGGIQPGPLMDYVAQAKGSGAGADGLLQRFSLLIWPDEPVTWRNVDRRPDIAARTQAHELHGRLAAIEPLSIGANADHDGDIPYLRLSDTAQERCDEWRAQHEARLRAEPCEAVESVLAKHRTLVPAVALLCHLADGVTGPVTDVAMDRAIAWGGYAEGHARRIYATWDRHHVTCARALADRLPDLPDPFSARDVSQRRWSLLNAKGTELALGVLEDAGWLRGQRREPGPQGGRPTVVYSRHPSLK